MRFKHYLSLAAILTAAVACDDQQPTPTAAMRPEARSALTVENLPANASSVCKSNVAARDAIETSGKSTTESEAQRAALSSVIADVCY